MKSPVHLNALRAFEASARHQSFSAAADELNVTPAAVGQLVRTLEEWLGTPVFHRSSSGWARLVPTEAAERALPDIRAGFDRLALGLERLKEGAASGILTVTVSPAFAAKWLLTRIDMDSRTGFPTWDAWLQKAGLTGIPTKRGMQINNSAAVLQAAIDGHGVALARSVMARDDVAAGRLVRLFPEIDCTSELAYYVVHRPECATLPRLVAFRDWIISEAGPGQAALSRPEGNSAPAGASPSHVKYR